MVDFFWTMRLSATVVVMAATCCMAQGTPPPLSALPPPAVIATARPPPIVVPATRPPPAKVTAAPTAAPTISGSSPPPPAAALAPRPPPATATPTAAPIAAPTAVPTTVPTATPTTAPTAAPTKSPTKAPTKAPIKSCPAGQWINKAANTCTKCITKASPFLTSRGRAACYPPTTQSRTSIVCTPTVLPAFVRSNSDVRQIIPCINGRTPRVSVLLVTKSGAALTKFLTAGSYIKSSLRLNNTIPPRRARNGSVIFVNRRVGASNKLLIQFDDKFGTLRKKSGRTVRLTGVLNRGGSLLDYCFIAYLKVC